MTTDLAPPTPTRTPRPGGRTRYAPGRRIRCALGVLVVLLAGGAALAGQVSAAPRPALTPARIAAMAPAAQARLLAPLRRLAGTLDRLGRAPRYSPRYAGVELSAPTGRVLLYTTDPAAGPELVAAGRRADPQARWGRVRVERARYSRAVLDAAVGRLLHGEHPADLVAVSVAPTGTGLDVEVDGSPAAARRTTPRLGVPVRLLRGAPRTPKTWAVHKWHDTAPFIGGDVLTPNGHGYCTAGLPAVRRSTGQQVMVTAAHCFALGQRIDTGGGATGRYGTGQTGAYVGTVVQRTTSWDAELLAGATNNADESDTSGWKPLTSVAYSYVGDFVCQAGAASFYLGHPTPCGIEVTDGDIWFRIDGYWARGVEGVDEHTGWGSHDGDSGGTVFAVEPHGARQARGIVSSGGADGTPAQKRVDWTEAVDIFAADGLRLNPRT